jgi:hypothetical protein
MTTPVFGSATAATSFWVRFRHPVGSVASARCQDGFASMAEQPEPVPSAVALGDPHADSVKPRPLPARFSVVPPTEVTY